jgi:FixJ family two-component response regulator
MRGAQILEGRRNVLVVDDDQAVLGALQKLLWLHGYEPILFSSARDFKNHSDFDGAVCAVLDIHLNDGSGIELLSDLRAAGRCLPVVCMTGSDNPAARKAALNLGCIAFLMKPFAAQDLIEPLKRAAEGHRLE